MLEPENGNGLMQAFAEGHQQKRVDIMGWQKVTGSQYVLGQCMIAESGHRQRISIVLIH